MKKSIQFLVVAVLLFASLPLKAQIIGIESPIREKNLFIGFKFGVSAMDAAYTRTINNKTKDQFVNHSILYQRPDSLQILNCLAAGITLEHTLPYFSYGLDLMVTGINAQQNEADTTFRFATQDSAFFLHARVPVRFYFLKEKPVMPYLMLAPDFSTYVHYGNESFAINGYSEWNEYDIKWGSRNARAFHLNLVAGAGMVVKINVGDYQMWGRFEAAYNLGLLNTVKGFAEGIEITRKMRGWEATIGLSFPLFKNPSYSWMM